MVSTGSVSLIRLYYYMSGTEKACAHNKVLYVKFNIFRISRKIHGMTFRRVVTYKASLFLLVLDQCI